MYFYEIRLVMLKTKQRNFFQNAEKLGGYSSTTFTHQNYILIKKKFKENLNLYRRN